VDLALLRVRRKAAGGHITYPVRKRPAIFGGLMRIHDITQPLGTGTAVWPGDTPLAVSWPLRIDGGDSVNVATLRASVHAGTHADGFLHVVADGETPARMPLEAYIGRCVVVDARGRDVVTEADVAGLDLRRMQRVLFRTREQVDETEFPEPFTHLSPGLARLLGQQGVRLVGTDAPSVDPLESKTLDAHHALVAGRVAILENLLLSDVAAGEYTLIALPLRLTDTDSSPVRAVLLEGDIVPASFTGTPAGDAGGSGPAGDTL
jgi:arylformamidase